MSPAPPRFLITLGLALAVVGAGFGVFYLQQRLASSHSNLNGADSRLISDDHKIAAAERQILASAPQKQAAYEKAFAALDAAGVVHSASLPTRDSIHKREEMVKRFDDANTALEELLKNAGEMLRSELLKQGFSEYTSAKAAARFTQRAHVELLLKIRACDRESNTVFLQILDLLDARWGTWKPSAGDHLQFNKPADANAYNALRQHLVEISDRERAVQAEVQAQDAAGQKF